MLNKNEITTSGLEHYIEFASGIYLNLVANLSFYDLYKSLLKWSDNCIIEIKKNLLVLNDDKRYDYLEFVKIEIEHNFNFKKSDKALYPYLEKYNLKIEDFPFSNNITINQMLSEKYSEGNYRKNVGNTSDLTIVKNMHLNFFEYAIYIETHKILDIINKNRSGASIFKSNNSKLIFEELLHYLNIKDHTTRRNPAKLNAIWQTHASRKKIFKASTLKKEYLEYLNSIFGSSFTTKSLSTGSSYETIIDDWIKEQNF